MQPDSKVLAEAQPLAPSGKSTKKARVTRTYEPTNLPHAGVLKGWNPAWKTGYIRCDDGVDRTVDMSAFGREGLAAIKVGARVGFSLRPDGNVLAAAPIVVSA